MSPFNHDSMQQYYCIHLPVKERYIYRERDHFSDNIVNVQFTLFSIGICHNALLCDREKVLWIYMCCKSFHVQVLFAT